MFPAHPLLFRIALALGAIGVALPAWGDRAGLRQDCLDWLSEMRGEGHRGAQQLLLPQHEQKRQFLEEVFFPVTRQRSLVGDAMTYRDIEFTEDSVRISGFHPLGGPRGVEHDDVVIRWEEGLTEPHIEFRPGVRLLRLPNDMRIGHLKRYPDSLVKKMLLGHTLHPYSASDVAKKERRALQEDELLPKQVQLEGAEAVRFAIRRKENAFLFVAPTGVGKTEIFKAMLKAQVERYQGFRPPKLHILTAHMDVLVEQLERAARETFSKSKKPPRFIFADEFAGKSMDWLTSEVEKSDRPVILVTSSEAIQAKLRFEGATAEADYQGAIKKLQRHVSTFAIDEAHHAGADGLSTILNDLTKVNEKKPGKVFLYGTTATPFHEQNKKLVEGLFKDRDYWAYLDSPHIFEKRVTAGEPSGHGLDSILYQLEEALNRGELHPFRVTYMNPDTPLPGDTGGYFEKNGQRWKLKKSAMAQVIDDNHLGPAFERNQRAFVTVGGVTEAKELAEEMRKKWPGKRIGVLTSDIDDPAQVLEDFSKGKYDILVTVKMIDEGYNLPELSLYVDLTMSTGARQLLQRIGRITRLTEGKVAPAEVFTFQKISDTKLAHVLQRIQQIADASAKGMGTGAGPPPKPKTAWNQTDLEELVFWTRAAETRHDAENDIDRIFHAFGRLRGDPEPFGAAATNPTSNAARTEFNTLMRALDDHRGGAHATALNQRLFRAEGDQAKAADWIESYRIERTLRRQLLQTPTGTREAVVTFIRQQKRVPGRDLDGKNIERFVTDDEKAIVEAMTQHKVFGDASVVETLLGHGLPSTGVVAGLAVNLFAPENLALKTRLTEMRKKPAPPPPPVVPRAPLPIGLTAERVERDILNKLLPHIRQLEDGGGVRPDWHVALDRLNEQWAEYRTLLRQRENLQTQKNSSAALNDLQAKIVALESTLMSQPNLELLIQAAQRRPGTPLAVPSARDISRTMRQFTTEYQLSFP